jgi:hypothetical protein
MPVELIGEPVECPICSTTFVANESFPTNYHHEEVERDDPRDSYEGTASDPGGLGRRRHRPFGTDPGTITAPGICLILIGMLGAISGCGLAALGVVALAAQQNGLPPPPPGQAPPQKLDDEAVIQFLGGGAIQAVWGIVVVAGGIAMVRQRSYGMAMTGSILSIIPCFCCCSGVPFGIWSLVVLSDPSVRQAFK